MVCHLPARLGMGEELLCPGCVAAVGYVIAPWPPSPSVGPDGGQKPETVPGREYPEQLGDGLPANTRCFPPAGGRTPGER